MQTEPRSRAIQAFALLVVALFVFFRYGLDPVQAARVSDIRGTKHNLSAATDGAGYTHPTTGAGTVPTRTAKASSETQICVFCHTPHGGSTSTKPLWNRKVAGAGYTQSYVLYDSSTLDAKQVQGSLMQPGGSSKLCLSCHDGTVAVGNVNVLNGLDKSGTAQASNVIAMQSGVTTMPAGSGVDTGFTRNLGTELTNDHPISVSYNDTLAERDGELRKPSLNPTLIGVRTSTVKPKLPLQNTGGATLYDPDGDGGVDPYSINAQVQCTTCHDPHIRETSAATVGNQKFLRLNRFQELDPPSSSGFVTTDNAGDIICLACHDKAGASWAYSAHANSTVANELYSDTHADRREFPRNLAVWKAACLNCHDTHAVAGTRRLLREGTNEGTSTAGAPKAGGANSAALEETCYQCHDGGSNGTLQVSTAVPNIKTDFTTLGRRMPIVTAAQGNNGGNTSEVHDISGYFSADAAFVDCSIKGSACGKDFIEPRSKLGVGGTTYLKNRHVECTDCHNPHRVIRGQYGLPGALTTTNTSEATVNGASGGHHRHTDAAGYTHTNVISGVLRGSWGVEPSYSSDRSFQNLPSGYTVKRGDPASANITDCHGGNKTACDDATYVTREYQICLKCHSDYGYSDNNTYPGGNRPSLGYTGGTTSGTNGLSMYTNQAKEFQAPPEHKGAPASTSDSGAHSTYSGNNYRSWHPVMDVTGRGLTERGGITSGNNPWRAPWNNALGAQTMYCTDCHGSSTAATTAIPTGSNSWGPHGSGNDFILKGAWTNADSSTANLLCFKCHNSAVYVGGETGTKNTGFWQSSKGNLHRYHYARIGQSKLRCTWCHVAVPHGWKNKALLVNLRDVGPEAGQALGTHIADSTAINGYTAEPYYYKAVNKIKTFKASGNWNIGDCGNGDSDKWMRANADASKGEGICKSPP